MTEKLSQPITCAEAVRRLWAYLDSELAPDHSATLEEHLSFCRRCCGELEFAIELRAFLHSCAEDDLPPQARQRLEQFLEEL